MNLPLNIDWQQILLHMFNFVILAGGLYFILYKPIKDFITSRENEYAQREQDTASALERASALEAEYTQSMNNLADEMAAHRATVTKDSQTAAEAIIADAKAQSEKLISDAKIKAEAERKAIIDTARPQIAELAAMAAEKLLCGSGEPTEDLYDSFLKAQEDKHE